MPDLEITNEQKKKKKHIWTALFILINIAVIAATAINEFSGKPAGAVTLRFTRQAVLFLLCTALCFVALVIAQSLKYVLMMRSLGEPVSFRIAFPALVGIIQTEASVPRIRKALS